MSRNLVCGVRCWCALTVCGWCCAVPMLDLTQGADASPPVDFARVVRPILADKCLACHSGEEPQGSLRLSDRAAALSSGDSGVPAIVPGDPAASELVRRLEAEDPDERMPPADSHQLTAAEIEALKQWIAEGAVWTEHWSLRPLTDFPPPAVADTNWVRNDVDRFILARLESRGLTPSPEADRSTLIKRLSYDLLGLPPSIAEVDAFVRDTSPQAYDDLVERLLQSPHFGERWGRHWLDLAHYADSDGFEKDRARPDAYLYRDWVIQAINLDMPFDQFTIEQLAGDLLPGATVQQRIATGFMRQTLTNEEGGVDQEEFRVAACFDRTETVGTVWLGLTIGCVRCHDHKYDPLPHQEYYELFAFFNNSEEVKPRLPVAANDLEALAAALRPLEEQLAARYRELAPAALAWETAEHERIKALAGEKRDRGIPNKAIADALEMYPEKRVASTREKLFDYYVTEVARDAQVLALREEIAALHRQYAAKLVEVRTISVPRVPRTTRVFHRGDFLSPKEIVEPGVPAVLAPFRPRGQHGDRLDLARWLVSPENFLTPRVAVNQVWQHLFGHGLVRTPNDFGLRGEPPTHPELLDWLALRFQRELKWSRKELIRLIVSSATYRQSSHFRPEIEAEDPLNTLLFRQNRFRVESEIVRDLSLAVAGLLSPKIGGPSVFPPMPGELAKLSYANNFSWRNSQGEERYRRGMYTFFKRTIPHPNLMTFDSPDANLACVRRTVSNTPLQALTLLNNEVHAEAAQALAARVLTQGVGSQTTDTEKLAYALRLCLVRPAAEPEIASLQRLLAAARGYYATHEAEAAELASDHRPDQVPAAEAAAWVATVRVLLNLDEFVTRE